MDLGGSQIRNCYLKYKGERNQDNFSCDPSIIQRGNPGDVIYAIFPKAKNIKQEEKKLQN